MFSNYDNWKTTEPDSEWEECPICETSRIELGELMCDECAIETMNGPREEDQ